MAAVAGGTAAASTFGAKQAASLASSAISAFGAIQQGQAAAQSAAFESAQLQQNAIRERQIAEQEAEDFADQESRRRAALRARVGGSGTTLEGTPLAILTDLAGESEFQKLRILAGGETRASASENTARVRRFEGANAQRSGFFRSGASLLTGAGKFKRSTGSTRTARAGGAESVGA